MKVRPLRLLSVCLLISLLIVFQPAPLHAAPGDEHWSPQFGWPGVTTLVRAITPYKNRLYIGGDGDSTNTTVSVWDGRQWSNIGVFVGNFPSVYDLAWMGNSLYAGGVFTNVDGTTAQGLARWNGTGWSDMGVRGNAYVLLVDGTNLYVGGSFTNVAGVAATNIACWNGSAWSALGGGLGQSTFFVTALTMFNGQLHAGGSFTNSGAVTATNLARWNGTNWSGVGGGVGTAVFPDRVYALNVKDGSLYAAGIFTKAGAVVANNIARWDGTNWFAMGTGVPGTLFSLARLGNQLCVGGNFNSAGGIAATNFALWNGSSWSAAGAGLNGTVLRVADTTTTVFASGSFTLTGNRIVNQLAAWNGSTWNPIGAPDKIGGLSSTVYAITGNNTNLFVSGGFSYAGQTNATRIARYDGTNWSAFGSGLNSNATTLAIVGTNYYAGGAFSTGGGYHLLRWNGASWTSLNNIAFFSVNALATRSNDLFVAGYFIIPASDGNANWLTRWDGTNFYKVLAFEENTLVAFYIDFIGFTALAVQDTNIYLSGHFELTPCDPTLTYCTNCQNVMRFDGTYGRILGTGINSNANAIAVMGTNVYFAGPFTNAGGLTVSGIARWDGNSWSDVGGGVVGRGIIYSLAVAGTNLYASGTFTNLGGVPVARVAKWDGTTWSALGSSTRFGNSGGNVQTLHGHGSDLFMGGVFTSVGGKGSYYLARWNEDLNFDETWLALSDPVGGANRPFEFTVTAAGVPTYVVDRSTNLTSWTPMLTNSATPFDCIDSNAFVVPRQFYRARSQP